MAMAKDETLKSLNSMRRKRFKAQGREVIGADPPEIPADFPEWARQAVEGLKEHMLQQDCEDEPLDNICPVCYSQRRCIVCDFHKRFVYDMAIKRYIDHIKVGFTPPLIPLSIKCHDFRSTRGPSYLSLFLYLFFLLFSLLL